MPVLDALDYGLVRLDHCVSNVPNLFEATDYLNKCVGFHEFSEFTAEDVGKCFPTLSFSTGYSLIAVTMTTMSALTLTLSSSSFYLYLHLALTPTPSLQVLLTLVLTPW